LKPGEAVRNIDFAELDGQELINAVADLYGSTRIVAMFSGGHDSLCSMHLASGVPGFIHACHINTGIGIEQTREFARRTCAHERIRFVEYKAADYIGGDGQPAPQCYRDFVMSWGFPGPAQHSRLYQRLKERPIRHMIRDLERDSTDRVLLITGVRQEESARRMRHVHRVQEWEGTKIWVAPIWNWSKAKVNGYIQEHGLPRNEVSDNLHFSGECLCGAYAHAGELDEIGFFYPDAAEELRELQREAGFPWGWEDSPPAWYKRVQDGEKLLPGMDDHMMMCSSCTARHENVSSTDD